MTDKPAIILLGASALDTANQIKATFPQAELHGQAKRLPAADVDRGFTDLAAHLQALFRAGRPIIALTAAAIPIRLLAPCLGDKKTEPPVLAIAEDGSAVVPLLGGHRGANDLARRIAAAIDGTAAITTAGDLRLGIALDQPPAGWTIANPAMIKETTAALLAGEPVALEVRAGSADWLHQAKLFTDARARRRILVTDQAAPAEPGTLVYHPPTLALGVGCERGVAPAELIELVDTTLAQQGLAKDALAGVFSIALKAAEPAMHALADHLEVPTRFFSAETLEAQAPRLATPSDLVFRETGCHGVAEGAALAAAGASGKLIVEKTKSQRATLAIARADQGIDISSIGHPQGQLVIIGIGPGQEAWRTPEADLWLARADHWIGYKGYLDLLERDRPGLICHDFALGEEEDRARAALDLAASGQRVALISSGDAGIYAMASLVFELLDREEDQAWQRTEVQVSPGISALQAVAARAGAPIGHDFCTISLSDLMTPWPVIEQRLKAAAAGDFVIALYNPASLKRRIGLAKALDIIEQSRPGDTPVIIGKKLGRAGEDIEVTSLNALDQDSIDMLSLVMIGASQTRLAKRLHGRPFVYTPRGYLDDNKETRSA